MFVNRSKMIGIWLFGAVWLTGGVYANAGSISYTCQGTLQTIGNIAIDTLKLPESLVHIWISNQVRHLQVPQNTKPFVDLRDAKPLLTWIENKARTYKSRPFPSHFFHDISSALTKRAISLENYLFLASKFVHHISRKPSTLHTSFLEQWIELFEVPFFLPLPMQDRLPIQTEVQMRMLPIYPLALVSHTVHENGKTFSTKDYWDLTFLKAMDFATEETHFFDTRQAFGTSLEMYQILLQRMRWFTSILYDLQSLPQKEQEAVWIQLHFLTHGYPCTLEASSLAPAITHILPQTTKQLLSLHPKISEKSLRVAQQWLKQKIPKPISKVTSY